MSIKIRVKAWLEIELPTINSFTEIETDNMSLDESDNLIKEACPQITEVLFVDEKEVQQ